MADPGRPPLVTDTEILALLPGTVLDVAAATGLSKTQVRRRLERIAVRHRYTARWGGKGGYADRWTDGDKRWCWKQGRTCMDHREEEARR